ncbi:nucleoside-diphosphate-sugar epimerase [Motilibacter rhizosphaerae]|uniref:Nucleoside-diphosphate-sugar epimerase n=1 Tax=Motilibacter rhizosphaerae TaxID=598652 RepID=A0A4Q7NH22_9ACTN|nr:NAD-dependent epimerase/dehydratase family protein [Motilibacter rhizosphaerae]RZS82746.1 nucleoside-diphosphate-sugar epimerase [Motilibacter rhizosphaerae]
MRVVVTGASGNVGTALLRALARERPEWRVTGIARRPPHPEAGPPYDRVRWVSLDLASPDAVSGLRYALEGADAVVHLAWAIQPSHQPAVMAAVNLDGTRHVVEAVLAAGVPHLVHASSLGTYAPVPRGRTPKPRVDESWPATGVPASLYSRHKAVAERLLDGVEGPVVARIRPGLVLQPVAGSEIGRYFLGPLAAGIRLARAGLPVVPLPREMVADAVHADDVADALVRILDQRAGGAFNLAAEDPLSPPVIAEALRARWVPVPYTVLRGVLSASWYARVQPTDTGWLDLARAVPLLDTGRARSELGWAPRHTAREALLALTAAMSAGRGGRSPVLEPRADQGTS